MSQVINHTRLSVVLAVSAAALFVLVNPFIINIALAGGEHGGTGT